MSDRSFYEILGVTPSANAEEIKSAYRELVKQHHPDLFSAAGAKENATEKLRLINEAYSVLGNPKRREKYDRRFTERSKETVRTAAARGGTARSPRYRNLRSSTAKIKIPKGRLHLSKKQAAYMGFAAMIVLTGIYATRSEPRWAVSYTLYEKLEISSPNDVSAAKGASHDWTAAGQYASVADCAGALKERVRIDEQEGSRAVFGAPNGTMAITVRVTNQTPEPRQKSIPPVSPDQSAANGITSQPEQKLSEESLQFAEPKMAKRVRSLECRATRRLIPRSWLQRLWS